MIPRDVVKLAASRATTRLVRDWLSWDEAGSWEKHARDMIEKSAERRAELAISDEAAASEIADRLRFLANTAVMASVKADGRKGKKR